MCAASLRLALVSAASLVLSPLPALGQDDERREGVEEAVAGIEQITVTARKREEDLQRTPLSLTALQGSLLEDAAVADLTSVEALTPNLSFSTGFDGGSSAVNAFVRGVGQRDHVITSDPAVGVYMDGVYLSRVYGANLELADIERISVLRGPQGTLFGKNTIGGAINVITRKPSGEFHYSLKGTVGSYNYRGLHAYIEFPIIKEQLSAGISLLRKDSDGWGKRAGQNSGDDDLWGARAQLYWTPTDSFSSQLIVDNVHQDQVGYPRELIGFNPAALFAGFYNGFVGSCCTPNSSKDRSNATRGFDRDDLDNFGANLTNTWDLGPVTLKSITGYRTIETDIRRDSDNDPVAYFHVPTEVDHHQFSQELLVNGTFFDERLDWVVGGYYFEEDADHLTELSITEGLFSALSVIPPLAPLAPLLDLTSNFDRRQETKSFAFFAHTTLSVTERLRLTLAARYTREDKDYTLTGFKRESLTPILAPGPTTPSSCTDVTLRGIESHFNCDEDWTEFSPKAGLDYQWTDDLMTYVHVSRGFRSGRFNGRPTFTLEVSEADPETLTSYEIGVKSQWLKDRLRVNAAAFINKYRDQQVLVTRATPFGLAILTDNAGRSTMQGFELEITALPLPGLTLISGVSYVDAEFDSWDTLIRGVRTDVSNRPFADTPEWNASLMAQYAMPLGDLGSLDLVGSVAYKSDVHYTNDRMASSFDVLNPGGYTIYNAGLIYTTPDERWEFALQGKNLTDKRTLQGGFGVDAFGHVEGLYTPPRRVFFSVKYSR